MLVWTWQVNTSSSARQNSPRLKIEFVELRQDDRRAAQIFLGDDGAADPAVLVDIGVALDPVAMVGEVDHPFAQVGAVDEMVERFEGQQVGIAVRLVADVDQRLALVIAVEERPRGSTGAIRKPSASSSQRGDGARAFASLRRNAALLILASPGGGDSIGGGAAQEALICRRAEAAAADRRDRARARSRAARRVAVAGAVSRRSSSGSRNAASTARAAAASRISRGE